MWYVSDIFGFAWGDVVKTLEEAQEQLRNLREDLYRRGYDDIDLIISRA